MELHAFNKKKNTLDLHTLPLLMVVRKNVTSRCHTFLYQNQYKNKIRRSVYV